MLRENSQADQIRIIIVYGQRRVDDHVEATDPAQGSRFGLRGSMPGADAIECPMQPDSPSE